MKKIKNKNIVILILLALLTFSSIGMYSTYPKIKNAADTNENDRIIAEYIANDSRYFNYVVDSKLKSKYNLNTDFRQYMQLKSGSQDYLNQELEHFTSSFNYFKNELEHKSNIKYYAFDNENHNVSNTEDQLSNIQNDKELQEKYQFYVQIQFDKNGNLEILSMTDMKGYDSYRFAESYRQNSLGMNSYDENDDGILDGEINYISPKNITITYAVPTKVSPTSDLAAEFGGRDSIYLQYTLPYMLCFVALTMLITFFIPVHTLNDNKFFNFIINIKFEILGILWCILVFLMTAGSSTLVAFTIQDLYVIVYMAFGIEAFAHILTPALNFMFWFVYFGLFMILAYCIKYLFHVGFKRYFIENTCLGWLFKQMKRLINYVMDIDFKSNTNKAVLKIVLANFIIISIISVFWAFGILFAFVYSGIIFLILKKKFDEIQDDYKVLLDATQELSNGHFDVHINQDVGIFNPLKDEFSHIKDGFEKAVNEEVKSQKMKTELISNVSHDLKTPLTSIITYIDLLKNNELSDDEKQNYIQIIDRNSLRLKNLIDDLFEVSKANSGDVKLDFVDVDIVSLIKQAQFECNDKLDEKQLDLRMMTNQDKIICHLDSFKTYRIFENLFINISKYALAHTRVYIDICDNDEDVIVTFKNISESEMNFNESEIVERFVQGDKSRNTSGSGLGLAIVKSFTELQNGQFKVDIDGDLFKSTLIFKK